MLYDLIYGILILPLYSVAKSLHGQWSSLNAFKDFFWLFPLICTPGLILAAPVAFGVVGLATGCVADTRKRLYVTIIGGFLYVLLAGIMEYVAEIGLDSKGKLIELFPIFATTLNPTTAFGTFGFWLPTIVCGTYTTLAKHPKWWISSLLGTAFLILGVWIWILLGILVGAETD